MAEEFEYEALEYDDLDALKEDMDRVLEEGSEVEVQLRSIQPYTQEWTDKKTGEARVSHGVTWGCMVVNADDPRDNGFFINQRTGWGSHSFKRCLLNFGRLASWTGPVRPDLALALKEEDELLNYIAEQQPLARVTVGMEKWKDRDTDEQRQKNRLGKFLDD